MATPLRLLLVEDDPSDAALALNELRRAGYDPIADRVETEQDFRDRLQGAPAIILADFSMPQFNSIRALEIMQECRIDIPFIILSGTIGAERAALAIQRGVAAFISKDRLGHLPQAVAQSLEQRRLLDEKRRAEKSLAGEPLNANRQQDATIAGSGARATVPDVEAVSQERFISRPPPDRTTPAGVLIVIDQFLMYRPVTTKGEALQRMQLASECIRRTLPLLSESDHARIDASGLTALLQEMEDWLRNPNLPSRKNLFSDAMTNSGRFFPQTSSVAPGVEQASRAITSLAESYRHTAQGDFNDASSAASAVLAHCREFSSGQRDTIILDQWDTIDKHFPNSLPAIR